MSADPGLDDDVVFALDSTRRHLNALQMMGVDHTSEPTLTGEDVYFLLAPVMAELNRVQRRIDATAGLVDVG